MPRYEADLAAAVYASEQAEERFTKRKAVITREVEEEHTRLPRPTLPTTVAILVNARMGKDAIAKDCVNTNQWQLQRAIMYGQLEIIEQNKMIIAALHLIANK